jgi:hypothetical protein
MVIELLAKSAVFAVLNDSLLQLLAYLNGFLLPPRTLQQALDLLWSDTIIITPPSLVFSSFYFYLQLVT